jgi:hypothetical protein
MNNNNIHPRKIFVLLLFLFLFCSNGTTAELTGDIIVAKEEAWARRAMEENGYRLRQHPLTHRHTEIKYKVPLLPSDGVLLQDKVNHDDATDDDASNINATTRDDNNSKPPVSFYLRGGRGAASKA